MISHARYSIKFLLAFINRFRGLILLGLLVGILFFFLIRWVFFPILNLTKTESWGVLGSYSPEKMPLSITSLISTGLTRPTAEGYFEPSLAEKWETPDKGKTWIFHLRDDIYWQDGSKIRSQDIVYNFSDVEIEKPDERTIVFRLKNPFSPFPSVLSKPVFKKGLLGTGDWQVKRIKLRGSTVAELLIKNKNGQRRLYKFYPTEESLKIAFKLGKIDKALNLIDPSPFDTWNTVLLESNINYQEIVTLFFNTQDSLLSEKSIRQALYYAIDRNRLSKTPAFTPIPPTSWAYNPLVKTYDYDPQKSKKIIDNLPSEIKEKLSLKISTTTALLPQAEKIAKMWEEIGLKTEVFSYGNIPEDYQILMVIFQPPIDPDQYVIWHSTQTSSNYSKYFKNPRTDALLEQGRNLLNLEERLKVYLDFQRFLLEDAPAAFLYHPEYFTIIRK